MNIPKFERRKKLINAMIATENEVWLGVSPSWVQIANYINDGQSNDAARSQYRKLVKVLSNLGYTVEDFISKYVNNSTEIYVGDSTIKLDINNDKLEQIRLAYCGGGIYNDRLSPNQISVIFDIPSEIIKTLASKNKWKRGTLPNSENKNVYRKELYTKKLMKESRTVKEDARKWKKFQHIMEEVGKIAHHYKPKKSEYKITKSKPGTGLAVWMGLSDLHYGKKYKNYNRDIAYDRVFHSLNYFLNQISNSKNINTFLLPIGSDSLNFDTAFGETTRRTPQSNDGDISDIINDYFYLLKEVIMTIRDCGYSVEAVCTPGNHDTIMAFAAAAMVNIAFSADKNVIVENLIDHSPRHYKKWGGFLLSFEHGQNINEKKASGILSSQARKMWGETEMSVVIMGHIHHHKVHSDGGTRVYYHPALSGDDKWHDDKGYVTNHPSGMGFVFDSENMGIKVIENVYPR